MLGLIMWHPGCLWPVHATLPKCPFIRLIEKYFFRQLGMKNNYATSIDAWEKSQRFNYYQSLFTATGNAETVWYTKTGTDHDFAFVPK